MKGKKLGIFALGVAAAVSFSVALVGCDKEGGSSAGNTISDETLADKFVAMFTFDDAAYDEDLMQIKVPAHDPYTGEVIEGLYAAYDSDEDVALPGSVTRNDSTTHDGGAPVYLTSINSETDPFFPGAVKETVNDDYTKTYSLEDKTVASGISFSFWYYRATADSSDWNAMITSEVTAGDIINYGNISWVGGSAYPSGGAIHGRAAYTDTSYPLAQAERALGQLRSSSEYTVYNAMAPEGADNENQYVAEMGNALTAQWLFMTVVVDEDAISFYRDGVLAYTYSGATFTGVAEIWENLYIDLLEPGLGMTFFGTENDVVDNLLIGKELTAEEVRALYEDVSATELTDNDVYLSSSLTVTVDSALETYTNSWWQTSVDYAQVELPTGDLNITYTADLYTDRSQVFYGPAFILFDKIANEGAGVQNTPAAGGVPMIYIRADNYAGMCANLSDADRAADAAAGALNVLPKEITFSKESDENTFKYTMAEEISYTKTDTTEGVTTNLHAVTPVKLVVNIVRTGNNWTVSYYSNSAEEANLLYRFTVQFSSTNELVLSIGGEGTYMENITVTNNTAGGAALTPTKTTSGYKTPVDLEGYTEV